MRLKFLLVVSLLCIQGLCATVHENITKYLDYLPSANFGQIGDHTKGEMQIVDNYDAILQVQNQYYNEFIQRGCSPAEAEKYSRVGVVAEDRYWIWLRDPLILPNGKTTAYNRFFPKCGLNGVSGVAVMGCTHDKKILVIIVFRHATREWEIELPRGGRDHNETAEGAAVRELKEETGFCPANIALLGSIATNSGILPNITDLFFAQGIIPTDETDREDCEIIHHCALMTKQQLKQAFVDGYIYLEIAGKKTKVFCRDACLSSAMLIAEAKGVF